MAKKKTAKDIAAEVQAETETEDDTEENPPTPEVPSSGNCPACGLVMQVGAFKNCPACHTPV